jgi:hypothetical protein
VDVVLVGLPGSGKTAVGRRLAHRHGAEFIDLDESVESADGRRIPQIFEDDGEAAFRALERAAVDRLGGADPEPAVRRVIATGGGAVVDPRNRWALYRRRLDSPGAPSMSLPEMETLLGAPKAAFEFSLWYLTDGQFIKRGDNGHHSILMKGVDLAEMMMDRGLLSPSAA